MESTVEKLTRFESSTGDFPPKFKVLKSRMGIYTPFCWSFREKNF